MINIFKNHAFVRLSFMTGVLIIGWFVLVALSYKIAEILLKKSGAL